MTDTCTDTSAEFASLRTAPFYAFDHQPQPDSCWSLSTGPDGRVYAASCCEHVPGGGAYIVRYNDQTDALDTVVDVPKAAGLPWDSGQATQCKIHYSFAPSQQDGILYAATHLSAPGFGQWRYLHWGDWKDDKRAFPYSVLLAYDTKADAVQWVRPFIPREGCRCLAISEQRGLLYAISYPRDHFYVYDLNHHTLRDFGRLGSVNAQAVFTDRRGRAFTSNDRGQLVRYDPDTDRLEELPVFLPHAPHLNGWHTVLYDVVASPEGDCVYGVPWTTDPRLFRYWPEHGPAGLMEDLGPVHQRRDPTVVVSLYLDHCGGLVFDREGKLNMAVTRWPKHAEVEGGRGAYEQAQVLVRRTDPDTLDSEDVAELRKPNSYGNYVSRGARDRHGHLFFGHVNHPTPVGVSRLATDRPDEAQQAHHALRPWG